MLKHLFLLAALSCATYCFGQKTEVVYMNLKDSTANYYIATIPEGVAPKALLVLIPGAFQNPESVIWQTALYKEAAEKGILTIIPLSVRGVESFGIDSTSQHSFHLLIDNAVSRYKLKGKSFYIGGFSLGGSAAVKYAELANSNNELLKPDAVFAIDPPLDFERYYNAVQRIIRLTPAAQVNKELPYMTNKIEQEMQGTPQTALENYYKLSPYSYSDAQQRAVKTMANTPIMLIHEPDVDWWLKERGYDYRMMNSIDESAMINELQKMGNPNAVLVTRRDVGYREPGHIRHPHSFSIVDNAHLLQWLSSFGSH
jgi:hypothetical protein